MILLLRHGQTTANAAGLLVGRSDPELTELGERQAVALAPLLGGVRSVWSSPLRRALATAALAIPGVAPEVHPAFIEVDYGTLEGRLVTSVSREQWREFEANHDVALGGGESLAAVDARVRDELEALVRDSASLLHHPTEHLAIVSHVSPVKAAALWALGVSGAAAWRTRLDNGSLTTIALRRARPMLVNFNVVPATSPLAQSDADRPEVQSGSDEGEGVEQFVVAKDPRSESRAPGAVDDRP